MHDWQKRVVTEKKDLAGRLRRLADFLKTDTFRALKEQDRKLLARQKSVMDLYDEVLAERISRFG